MKIKLARAELGAKPKEIDLEEIDKIVQKESQKIFYFDRDNEHKNLVKMIEYFEDKGKSVYLREVKYGLDDHDYIYEVHIM